MHDGVLRRMRRRVHTRCYVMPLHAEDELSADGLSIFDVEHGILTGEAIERQRDSETGEWKYVLKGRTLSGDEIVVIAKLSATGALVFITVYRV